MTDSALNNDQKPPSMLIEFRAENARSFRERLTLSLEATRVSEPGVVRHVPWREGGSPIGVLPGAAVFGANASGKSNLLRVMNDMRTFVLFSFRMWQPEGGIPVRPFRLSEAVEETPSRYEVDLILAGVRHEYGFAITSEKVVEEWAHSFPRGRRLLLFHRTVDEVVLGRVDRRKGRATEGILRHNALFLSTAAAAGHEGLQPLYDWFRRNMLFADEGNRTARQALTAEMLDRESTRERALALMREADLGITGANRLQLDPDLREQIQQAVETLRGDVAEVEGARIDVEFEDFELRLKHHAGSREVELGPDEESRGTLIWLGLIGPVLEVLEEGAVLLADELDASLHPVLVAALVRLFQSPRSNPRRAQLIFNSHDITLMGDSGERLLGRDQIWFADKDPDGGTHIYPLTDLDPRREEAIGRRYLAGRYGATPIVSQGQLEGIAETLNPVGDRD